MRHACPATWPNKTICAAFYYAFVTNNQRNVMFITPYLGTTAPGCPSSKARTLFLAITTNPLRSTAAVIPTPRVFTSGARDLHYAQPPVDYPNPLPWDFPSKSLTITPCVVSFCRFL
jgi:hypothetical protein